MTLVQARKNRNFTLDGYEEGFTKERVEGVGEGTVYQKLLEQYIQLHKKKEILFGFPVWDTTVDTVLKPCEINAFLSYVSNVSGLDLYDFGYFVTKLIKNSYENGNRRFDLDLMDMGLFSLFSDLDVSDLEVTVRGEAFGSFGAGYKGSKKCRFKVDSVGPYSLVAAINLTVLADHFGYKSATRANGVTLVGETYGEGIGEKSKKSIFKTPNPQTLQQLLIEVPQERGNTVALITPSGEEIERYSNRW
jgi:hypothetical protein